MNCGRGPAPATMVRCRQCSASVAAPPGARAVQCMQCCCVTRVGGVGRQHGAMVPAMRPIPGFGGGRGKKRAVLVGIKYTNTRACELRGPINDVKCMRYLLTEHFGFANDCVLILTDEERDPCRQPTKNNIRMAMHWLVQGCSSGDSLVFQFSGAGAQVPDCDGDERDGMDEAICPLDSFQQGPILDDEINQAIVRPLVHGVKLHAIVDACHSATVLDLPYQCTFSKQYGCLRWMDERLLPCPPPLRRLLPCPAPPPLPSSTPPPPPPPPLLQSAASSSPSLFSPAAATTCRHRVTAMALDSICGREKIKGRERRKERREKGRGKKKWSCVGGRERVTGRSAADSSPFTPRWSREAPVQPSRPQGSCEEWKVEAVHQPEQQKQGSGGIRLPVARQHCISFMFYFQFYMMSYRLA